jgi:DNA-binding beta-propeller fold protein YncE
MIRKIRPGFRPKFGLVFAAIVLWLAGAVQAAGTFGTPVQIFGQASDVALDEARGVLYIANFTANRIDVMSLATNRVVSSMGVAPNPSSISVSPNGKWLVVTHFRNNAPIGNDGSSITLINLENRGQQRFATPDPPVGAAFGFDN